MEKLLAVLFGTNWAPVATLLSGMLIHLLLMSALFFYIYKKDGKRQMIRTLLVFGGFEYIRFYSKYDAEPTTWWLLLALIFAIMGICLMITGGIITGAMLSAKEKNKLLAGLK